MWGAGRELSLASSVFVQGQSAHYTQAMIDTFLPLTFWKGAAIIHPLSGWHLAPSSPPAPTVSTSLSRSFSHYHNALLSNLDSVDYLVILFTNIRSPKRVNPCKQCLNSTAKRLSPLVLDVCFGLESRIWSVCKQRLGVWETELSETWDNLWKRRNEVQ